MTSVLFITHPYRYLAQRWLETSHQDERIILLCETDAYSVGQELMRRFPKKVVACRTTQDDPLPGDCDTHHTSHIIVPVSFENRPLQYRSELEMPWLHPFYPLFSRLWHKGFRTFELYSLAGTQHITMPFVLDAFHNRHAGKRCFVVGNGPSLNQIDMSLLKNEITLGSNQCYLGYSDWGFPFTYWGIYDQYQIEEYASEYERHVHQHASHFFPFEYMPLLKLPNACPVNLRWCRDAPHQFSGEPSGIYRGFTVTYMLLQIAAIMGCNPIILVGIDHNYVLKKNFFLRHYFRQVRRWGTRKLRDHLVYDIVNGVRFQIMRSRTNRGKQVAPPLWERKDATAPTHFTGKYTDPGVRKFALPEPIQAEADFRCARVWAQKNRVQILNATPDSHLKVFETVSYPDLFS